MPFCPWDFCGRRYRSPGLVGILWEPEERLRPPVTGLPLYVPCPAGLASSTCRVGGCDRIRSSRT